MLQLIGFIWQQQIFCKEMFAAIKDLTFIKECTLLCDNLIHDGLLFPGLLHLHLIPLTPENFRFCLVSSRKSSNLAWFLTDQA